jgi:serine/threonine-protein kinase
VRPDELTISSNGHVDSAEPALEYGGADWQIAGLSDCE